MHYKQNDMLQLFMSSYITKNALHQHTAKYQQLLTLSLIVQITREIVLNARLANLHLFSKKILLIEEEYD